MMMMCFLQRVLRWLHEMQNWLIIVVNVAKGGDADNNSGDVH